MKKRTCADRIEQNQESLRGGLKGERRTHMTLSQIIAQALRQLGEDPQDVSEYEEAFKVYANMGYDIAVREYLKPRREMCLDIDGNGRAPVVGVIVNRVIRMTDEDGRDVAFDLAGDGRSLTVWRDDLKGKTLRALCEVSFPPMEDGEDEPLLPAYAHAALADYICYRHLSSGNLAKQSRAQFYQNSFYQEMNRIRPQGMGSVTRMRNLYEATDVRYRR